MQVPEAARASAALPAVFVICTVLAVANLCGWLFGIRQLVSMAPGLPAMVPVTALLSLLMAGGLWTSWRWPQRPFIATAGPAAVIALGLVIETCYLAGAAPGPFLLVQAGRESGYNLSSPVTAGMFIALGLASLLLARGAKVRTAQGIGLGVFLLALLNLTGYLFRDTSLFALLPGRGTSILTSLQVLLLAAGVLLLRPGSGLMAAMTGRSPSARIARRLLVSAFLVPVATGAALFASAQAGLFDMPSVLPLFAWLVVVLLLTIIWRFALQLRTVDLARAAARAELQAALEALRAEHDRKDIFLATLAHELRNPLAPVSAAADVLRLGGAASVEDRRRLGNVIGTQVGNIVDLVNDLLDVERITRGRLALDRQVLDIREPIAGAFE
ncbi:phospho-acceptor domain-containing protein [Pseudoduganella lurida]|uniref:histidine kinase n=1 Tax=Pseudoduganella lurida TaxID=1036180 RepID=A0A562R230_9BURK|nr:histidine kinase dimerization/phospho-acceptor domain-containing protein [Pseudoduganella lurida]TWI62644.1 phospho-acceptor domain-containing protein [Pseudoduganella lurida]